MSLNPRIDLLSDLEGDYDGYPDVLSEDGSIGNSASSSELSSTSDIEKSEPEAADSWSGFSSSDEEEIEEEGEGDTEPRVRVNNPAPTCGLFYILCYSFSLDIPIQLQVQNMFLHSFVAISRARNLSATQSYIEY